MQDDDGTPQGVRQKLVDTKQQWARDGRLLTGRPDTAHRRRLPPGQHEVRDWPVLDLGSQPDLSLRDWTLTVEGLVERPVAWSWQDFLAQPQVEMTSDIHCVTSWSRFDNRWQGISARRLLEVVRPRAEVDHVLFTSYDSYTTNLDLAAFADEDVLLATHWEGKPLSREHGGPVRVVVPKRYFWKSAKWIKRIRFVDRDHRGYWEVRGYHNRADPWLEERYS
jgi:DMSO/TMAO reductase YedYZ molybdopterin-dependent catalytic subunit